MNMLVKTLFLVLLQQVSGASVLVIGITPTYSHFVPIIPLIRELADRGHEVRFFNSYEKNVPVTKNCTNIFIDEVRDYVTGVLGNNLHLDKLGTFANLLHEFSLGLGITERVLNSSQIQDLLSSQQTFDLVIIEHFYNEAIFGIAHHFKAPIILLSSLGPSFKNNYLLANPAPASYVPNILTSFSKHMNFWERTENLVTNFLADVLRETQFMPEQRKIFRKYFGTSEELDDVIYDVSLILANSHVSSHDAVPQVPNVVSIGGCHLDTPKKLPQDLQNYLDTAEHGVVLFSLGSILRSQDLTAELQTIILNVFSKIKQKVLWKFEAQLTDLPKNVKIVKWLPQQDLLAHPNVRLFIQHGGLLSLIETIYNGVPILGLPVFSDQKNNIKRAVENGYARSLCLSDLTEKQFSWALNEVLHNPIYRENAQKRSKLMRDQPMKPLDSAIYWIEHVIRYQGAPHLRSAGLDLKWYQRENIDVFAFLLLVVMTMPVIAYMLLKTLIKAGKYKKHAAESNTKKIK